MTFCELRRYLSSIIIKLQTFRKNLELNKEEELFSAHSLLSSIELKTNTCLIKLKYYLRFSTAFTVFTIISIDSSNCSSVITSGGDNRIIEPCVFLAIRPLSFICKQISHASPQSEKQST